MLKFKCDRCGKEIARDEAWAIVLAPGAYAAEGSKKRTQGEICGDCAEIILKEMIYLDEVPARDCHGASLLAMTEGEVPARDCTREGYAASVTLVPRERLRNHGAERIAMTEGEVPARDCRVASLLAMTEEEVSAEKRQGCREVQGAVEGKAHQGCRAIQNGNAQMQEGRCITVARKRAGLTMEQVADKLYVSKNCIGNWERGVVKKFPWDEIEMVLPEVKEIREKGCGAFCPSPKACLGGGKCYYSGKKV